MVNDQNQDTLRDPAKQGVRDVPPEPNKIGASTPYDFGARNLTAYGGLLPVATLLEKLGFQPYFTSATGLFSTALDYRKLMSMMLHRGKAGGRQLLSPTTVSMALGDHAFYVFDPDQLRKQGGPFEYNRYWGLNWWVFTDKYGAMQTPVAPGSFSIYGITGAFTLADPKNDLICIFLTQTQVNQPDIFRPLIHAVYATLME